MYTGSMTFGEQNSLGESFGLLDKAFDSGINFFDSAEMYVKILEKMYNLCLIILSLFRLNFVGFSRYPVPQRAETQGRSEEYLGRWITDRKIPRDAVVLATKVVLMFMHCYLFNYSKVLFHIAFLFRL